MSFLDFSSQAELNFNGSYIVNLSSITGYGENFGIVNRDNTGGAGWNTLIGAGNGDGASAGGNLQLRVGGGLTQGRIELLQSTGATFGAFGYNADAGKYARFGTMADDVAIDLGFSQSGVWKSNTKFSNVADAVNGVTIINNTTGYGPRITATGSDTNIDLQLQAKGTGKLVTNCGLKYGSGQIDTVTDTKDIVLNSDSPIVTVIGEALTEGQRMLVRVELVGMDAADTLDEGYVFEALYSRKSGGDIAKIGTESTLFSTAGSVTVFFGADTGTQTAVLLLTRPAGTLMQFTATITYTIVHL